MSLLNSPTLPDDSLEAAVARVSVPHCFDGGQKGKIECEFASWDQRI